MAITMKTSIYEWKHSWHRIIKKLWRNFLLVDSGLHRIQCRTLGYNLGSHLVFSKILPLFSIHRTFFPSKSFSVLPLFLWTSFSKSHIPSFFTRQLDSKPWNMAHKSQIFITLWKTLNPNPLSPWKHNPKPQTLNPKPLTPKPKPYSKCSEWIALQEEQ